MFTRIKRVAVLGIVVVFAGSAALPALAAPKSLPTKAQGKAFVTVSGEFMPPGQLKKAIKKAEKESRKENREDEKEVERVQSEVVKAQEKAFKSAIKTAREAFNRAFKAADEMYKTDKKAARDTLLAALAAANGNQTSIDTATAAYRSALSTALQRMLSAKQAAIAQFIAALQSVNVPPPTNQAPTANGQSATVMEDGSLAITLIGSDPESSALSYTVVAGPAHGILSGVGASRTYTPSANFNGSDSFSFKVNDGSLDSASATVAITVTAVNDSPVAVAQNVTTTANVALALTLAGSDVDGCSGQTFTYSVNQPANGSVAPGSGNASCSDGILGAGVTYTPVAGFTGNTSFGILFNDGLAGSASATVSVAVGAVL